jgi:NAD(P)-dependent dehydrogenase (short-subunit alcohol dehydrogenase family)
MRDVSFPETRVEQLVGPDSMGFGIKGGESCGCRFFSTIRQPQDIATVATFLSLDDSGWITGETLLVSGGFR